MNKNEGYRNEKVCKDVRNLVVFKNYYKKCERIRETILN
jgi:hypothetical protein